MWGREEMYRENNNDCILLNTTYLCLDLHDSKISQPVSSYKAWTETYFELPVTFVAAST